MKLRDYQTAACRAFWQAANRSEDSVIATPTGSGKSLIAAELTRQAIEWEGRVIIVQHRKELIRQNQAELMNYAGIESSVYSAGLKSKDAESDVVFAGVQSIWRDPFVLEKRHLCIIDEAHMADSETQMYGKLIGDLKTMNPNMRFCGLSATPYRMGTGCLTEGDIFDSICYSAPVAELIENGYLCKLTNKPAKREVSMDGVRKNRGEFSSREMEDRFLAGDNVTTAVSELVTAAEDRNSVLVFAAGVAHAERIANELEKLTNEKCGVVVGTTIPLERQTFLEAFKNGSLRWLVNCDVLTTGFNARNIDCIAVMRATASPGLFAQIAGRGFRVYEDKEDCLILDFGGNIERHGPLDSESYGKKKKPPQENDNLAGLDGGKECPQCRKIVGTRAAFCECGYAFPANHDALPETEEDILAKPKEMSVHEIYVVAHVGKTSGKTTMRVDYRCALHTVSEYVCFDHVGYAHAKAAAWWAARSTLTTPSSVADAVDLWQRGACRNPVKITVHKDGNWWRIDSVKLEDDKPSVDQLQAEASVDLFEAEDIPF